MSDSEERVIDQMVEGFRRRGAVAPRDVGDSWLAVAYFGVPWRASDGRYRAQSLRIMRYYSRRTARRADVSDTSVVVAL